MRKRATTLFASRRRSGHWQNPWRAERKLEPSVSEAMKRRPARAVRRRQRRGIFLIIALVVIAIATLIAMNFSDLMLAYDESAYLAGQRTQAEQLAASGIDHARLLLTQPRQVLQESGGIYNNQSLFHAVNVIESLQSDRRGNFTVITSGLDELGQTTGYRYGLQNESARLNINVLMPLEENLSLTGAAASAVAGDEAADDAFAGSPAATLLLMLPGMTEDVADAILDWVDEDDEPRPYGAERDYYIGQPTPYEPRNGPIDSVEELLLVRGVTAPMLFGMDANRNGMLDASEQSMAVSTTASGSASLGWSSYLTVYSKESNLRDDGQPRIDINGEDLELLYADLVEILGSEDWASFIVAYRIAGQPPSSGQGPGSEESGRQEQNGRQEQSGRGEQNEPSREAEPWTASVLDELDLSEGGQVQFQQVLDLIGATVTLGEGDEQVTFNSPFADDPLAMTFYLEALSENLTAQNYESLPGRININECPAELVYGLPGISEEAAQAIVESRGSLSDGSAYAYDYWPLAEGIVTLQEMKALSPLVTSGGDVFRVQSVGYFEGSNASARFEAVIDATDGKSRLLFWRDLSHLGRGFDVSALGIRGMDALQQMQQSAAF